jgi:hypothetical protein
VVHKANAKKPKLTPHAKSAGSLSLAGKPVQNSLARINPQPSDGVQVSLLARGMKQVGYPTFLNFHLPTLDYQGQWRPKHVSATQIKKSNTTYSDGLAPEFNGIPRYAGLRLNATQLPATDQQCIKILLTF